MARSSIYPLSQIPTALTLTQDDIDTADNRRRHCAELAEYSDWRSYCPLAQALRRTFDDRHQQRRLGWSEGEVAAVCADSDHLMVTPPRHPSGILLPDLWFHTTEQMRVFMQSWDKEYPGGADRNQTVVEPSTFILRPVVDAELFDHEDEELP